MYKKIANLDYNVLLFEFLLLFTENRRFTIIKWSYINGLYRRRNIFARMFVFLFVTECDEVRSVDLLSGH